MYIYKANHMYVKEHHCRFWVEKATRNKTLEEDVVRVMEFKTR